MKLKLKYDFKTGLEAVKKASKTFPNGSGIYKFMDCNKKVLYVGKAKNLKKRISSYVNDKSQTNRIKLLINLTTNIDFIKTVTEVDSFILENNLIKQYKPRFNVRLIDDKSYPYICITSSSEWPRIKKYRGKQNKNEMYFGPYSSVSSVDNVIRQIEGAFLLRSCTDNIFKSRKRPCILYQIKRCSAPCVDYVSKVEYKDLVDNAISFLNGNNSEVKSRLITQMKSASELQNYEKAAKLRDRISALSKISNETYSDLNNKENFDVIFLKKKENLISIHIFFFRSGKNLGNKDFLFEDNLCDETEKIFSQFLYFFYTSNAPPNEILLNTKPQDINILKSLLENKISIKIPLKGKKRMILKMVEENIDASFEKRKKEKFKTNALLNSIKLKFTLKNIPKRIEIYDNSHLSGSNPTGAMVVFENGAFVKNSYRKFNIECENNITNDDYFMMDQVMNRRFKNLDGWKQKLPQLILIDGGLGQLNIVKKILAEKKISNIDILGIAKGKNRNAGDEKILKIDKEFKLNKNDEVLFFFQRLRDEAHRFAVQSTKAKHHKSFKNSLFDEITGIGKKTKNLLLSYFGTIDNIKTAGEEDLKKVPGIGIKTAARIYKEFNKNV
jgi:excinuclease ABC subunit C